MANLRIKLVKSTIGAKQNMKDTLRTLGLRKIGQDVVREDTEAIRGAVLTVRHLVTVEEVD
ncbi:MAG: 50S ribosomal protein L30 [Actinomyces sp.]|nr:50S ribosomal protein L30 [Actinomyces sp.]MDN6565545.1 50S ribosomal protein L30 [Actinomyces sp.]MDN6793574.1 50S ribosomal protein L30 [Propionibacterium sp.]